MTRPLASSSSVPPAKAGAFRERAEEDPGFRRDDIVKRIIVLFLLAIFLSAPPAAAQTKAPVYVLTLKGAIGPALSGYLKSGLDRAAQAHAQLVVLELDTPGGLLTSTRDMVADILQSPVPVAAWVTPQGAHAASAGTFLMYAANIAAMNRSTNIGAATPIETGSGGKIAHPRSDSDSLHNKMLADTSAFIRSLAELRGRNADWAEKAVTEADSLTAGEALEKGVIDLIAESREELLKKLDGRRVTMKNSRADTLETAGAPIVELRPDLKTRLLVTVTDPNVAMILMSIGVYGIILEFYHPGSFAPGTVGVISLLLGLYAMNVLPLNMTGVLLMLLGFAFMIAEAFIPSFGIVGFTGVIAFLAGGALMFDTAGMPGLGLDWGLFAGIGALGLLIMGLVVFVTMRVYRRKTITGAESMIGSEAVIVDWHGGTHGRVHIQGETWKAVSPVALELKKGDRVTVAALNDLTLTITV
jgi:membrane-bound serine protease (ClpP class)